MPLNPTQLARLALAAAAAVATEKDTKLPAELTVPQWGDESGWGERDLNGPNWPAADALKDRFDMHAQVITTGKPYANAWARFLKDGDKAMFAQRVAHSYGTDPMYGTKLARIAMMPEVRAGIIEARKPLVTIQPSTAATPQAGKESK